MDYGKIAAWTLAFHLRRASMVNPSGHSSLVDMLYSAYVFFEAMTQIEREKREVQSEIQQDIVRSMKDDINEALADLNRIDSLSEERAEEIINLIYESENFVKEYRNR